MYSQACPGGTSRLLEAGCRLVQEVVEHWALMPWVRLRASTHTAHRQERRWQRSRLVDQPVQGRCGMGYQHVGFILDYPKATAVAVVRVFK